MKPKTYLKERGLLTRMIKALIFDFWGTLVENGVYPSPVKQAQFILGIETDFSEYIQKFEETLMLNKFENLNEGFTKVCETFGIEATEEKIERLVGMWNKNKFFAKPKPDTISTLETLKRSYKLVLVSNTDCFSVKDVLEKYDLAKYFDEIFFSYEVGKLKTDPHFFDDVLEKIGLSRMKW